MTAEAQQLTLLPRDFAWHPKSAEDSDNHGEIFTRRWIVELILDLAGYTADRDLALLRAVEPCCGAGAFVTVMVERLVIGAHRHGRQISETAGSIVAYDLRRDNVAKARRAAADALISGGVADCRRHPAGSRLGPDPRLLPRLNRYGTSIWSSATRPTCVLRMCRRTGWLPTGPPVPPWPGAGRHLRRILRESAAVSFGTPALPPSFWCADRWMRNQYGSRLRELISSGYAVEVAIAAHDVDAFESRVSAYPAITVVRRTAQRGAVVATADASFDQATAHEFAAWSRSRVDQFAAPGIVAARLPHWFEGDASWPTGSPARLALLEQLNDTFEPIEKSATGTRIGIGVATGADAVYVRRDPPDIEVDRLLPLAMSQDTRSGELRWSGTYLVNPWGETGDLVELAAYPRLAAYLDRHAVAVRARNVAQRLPQRWFRTIDRVDPALTCQPKLLFPDLKMTSHPVYDPGGHYPHHNLYYIVSAGWDLQVLGGLLLSRVAQLFVDAYSVRMRGGTLRFQAQYLRRIRVPGPGQIPPVLKKRLRAAFLDRDVEGATSAAMDAYRIDSLPD